MASSQGGLRVIDISTACQNSGFFDRIWSMFNSRTFTDSSDYKTLDAGIASYSTASTPSSTPPI